MRHHPILLVALALAIAIASATSASAARADEPEPRIFLFSGFGTLGATHSSESMADFTSSSLKPNGAGFTHGWSVGVDSVLGVQVTGNFTPQLSAVVQVVLEQQYNNSYAPAVEWANIKYQFTPEFSVRAGRIALPVFLVSDYRKVGYANPWVRPPVEVYGLLPVGESDGVDASYRLHTGELTHTLQGMYGRNDVKLPGDTGTAKARGLWGISYTAEYGAATLHASYFHGDLTLDSFNPLFDGFRQFGPAGIAIADKYDANAKLFTFLGVGAMYDPGRWFVMAEWGATDSNSAIGNRSAWYVSGGYRLDSFTPYFSYAQTRADSNRSDPGLDISQLPPYLVGPAAALNAGLNAILGGLPVQKTLSIGGRWDVGKNVDVKVQLDRARLGSDSAGTLVNIQPGFRRGGSFNVVSATIDFVF